MKRSTTVDAKTAHIYPLDKTHGYTAIHIDTMPHGDSGHLLRIEGDLETFALRVASAVHEVTGTWPAEPAPSSTLLRLRAALGEEIKEALEGDSNDREHDALASVAEALGIEYTDPYSADDSEDPAAPRCEFCGEIIENVESDVHAVVTRDGFMCGSCVHDALRSGADL